MLHNLIDQQLEITITTKFQVDKGNVVFQTKLYTVLFLLLFYRVR